jgi:hypothetical protein
MNTRNLLSLVSINVALVGCSSTSDNAAPTPTDSGIQVDSAQQLDGGGTSDSGPSCSSVVESPRTFCSLSRAKPQTGLELVLREPCASLALRSERCEVEVVGTEVRIRRVVTQCSNDVPAPPACRVADLTCAVPPLAAGTYKVVVGQRAGALVPDQGPATGDLIVTADGTQTKCKLGPLGEPVASLDPAKYDTACKVDADCTVVSVNPCCSACATGVVASSSRAKYDSDYADAATFCPRGEFGACACAPSRAVCGLNNKCSTVRQ